MGHNARRGIESGKVSGTVQRQDQVYDLETIDFHRVVDRLRVFYDRANRKKRHIHHGHCREPQGHTHQLHGRHEDLQSPSLRERYPMHIGALHRYRPGYRDREQDRRSFGGALAPVLVVMARPEAGCALLLTEHRNHALARIKLIEHGDHAFASAEVMASSQGLDDSDGVPRGQAASERH